MIVKTAVQWYLSYLLLAAHATLTSANPLKNKTEPQHYCGKTLQDMLNIVCEPQLVSSSTEASNEVEPQSKNGQLIDECCHKKCNEQYLSNYCEIVKPQTYELNRTLPDNYCGSKLQSKMDQLCLKYGSYFTERTSVPSSREAINEGKIRTKRAATVEEECCKKSCTIQDLSSYCEIVRPQIKIIENQPSSREPDAETSAQTDPPYRPEIAYDGEYSDQEPLTLLPTYTSPEYTNDLLLRL